MGDETWPLRLLATLVKDPANTFSWNSGLLRQFAHTSLRTLLHSLENDVSIVDEGAARARHVFEGIVAGIEAFIPLVARRSRGSIVAKTVDEFPMSFSCVSTRTVAMKKDRADVASTRVHISE